MSGLRRLVREVARNGSYRSSGTTDSFHLIFDNIWRRHNKYPRNLRGEFRACKKNVKGGRKIGWRPVFYR